MTTITEAGNNLAAVQARLLAEKQALVDEMTRQHELFDEANSKAARQHEERLQFLDARIAEIDSMIGDGGGA
jgi:hydroxyethylthiazole kinase-like sugar kinase family protein